MRGDASQSSRQAERPDGDDPFTPEVWSVVYKQLARISYPLTEAPHVFNRASQLGYRNATGEETFGTKKVHEVPLNGLSRIFNKVFVISNPQAVPDADLPGVNHVVITCYKLTIPPGYLKKFTKLHSLHLDAVYVAPIPHIPSGLKILCLSRYMDEGLDIGALRAFHELELLELEPASANAMVITQEGLLELLRKLPFLCVLRVSSVVWSPDMTDAAKDLNLAELRLRSARGQLPPVKILRMKEYSIENDAGLPASLEILELPLIRDPQHMPVAFNKALLPRLVELDLRGSDHGHLFFKQLGAVVKGLPLLQALGIPMPTWITDDVNADDFEFLTLNLKRLMLSDLTVAGVKLLPPLCAEIVEASSYDTTTNRMTFNNHRSLVWLLDKLNLEVLKKFVVLEPFSPMVFDELTSSLVKLFIDRAGPCPSLQVPFRCCNLDTLYNIRALCFDKVRFCEVIVRLTSDDFIRFPLEVKQLKEIIKIVENLSMETIMRHEE